MKQRQRRKRYQELEQAIKEQAIDMKYSDNMAKSLIYTSKKPNKRRKRK
jgi:hypothetical protein